MVTELYDELYKAWRREKSDEALQPLGDAFYDRLAAYVRKLADDAKVVDRGSLKGRLVVKELDYVKRLGKDLIETRLEKIMKAAREGGAHIGGAPQEIQFAERLSSAFQGYLTLKDNVLAGRELEGEKIGEEVEPAKIWVRILKPIPPIVGVDMKTYGPFEPEDVASLPAENAEALVKQGAAAKINVA